MLCRAAKHICIRDTIEESNSSKASNLMKTHVTGKDPPS